MYCHKLHKFKEGAACAGLGSRELANDADLVPVRGQVRRVRAPWVKHAMFLDHTFYILPNLDSIVIGGTAQPGDERTEVDWEDSDRIWKHVLRMCPSLETAETVTDWVRDFSVLRYITCFLFVPGLSFVLSFVEILVSKLCQPQMLDFGLTRSTTTYAVVHSVAEVCVTVYVNRA